MPKIFVSYRRQDSAGHAGRIYDRLRSFFGSGRVFMDVEGIDLGTDFTAALDERIRGAEVVIAVIGLNWISASTPDGQRRLFSELDYVRYELATALASGIEVIPVLVAGAQAPTANELPPVLADLAQRQMYVISDIATDLGMARLIQGVERSAARTREMRRLSPRPASRFRERWWARLLLLYEPAHPAMWLVHILFFAGLVVSVTTPLTIWATGAAGDDTLRLFLALFFGMGAWLVVIRAVALVLEPDVVVSPLRRWFLLYNPPRALMSIVHLVFLVLLLLCLLAPVTLVQTIRSQSNDVSRAIFVQAWAVIIILTFVVREIGASLDPLRPVLLEPNWFARALCIWRPLRAIAWIPRIVYYSACFIVFLMAPGALVDAEGNFGNVDWDTSRGSLVFLGLLAAIAISARGAARASEVGWPGDRDSSAMQRAKSILLLYVPWRREGWAASVLFVLGLGLLVASTASGGATLTRLGIKPEGRPEFAVLSLILAICAWCWAQLYRPPAHWRGSRGASQAQD